MLEKFDSAEQAGGADGAAGWREVATCLRNYPAGLRYICFEDWSKDARLTRPYVAPQGSSNNEKLWRRIIFWQFVSPLEFTEPKQFCGPWLCFSALRQNSLECALFS